MPRILLVKTSSLGDVIHNLPVVSDIRARYPGALIDWVCETPYCELVELHPGVRKALPVNLRHLMRHLLSLSAWSMFLACKRAIGREKYDVVIDTQGLTKSAWIATFARGGRAGYDRASAREPLASRFYGTRSHVPRDLHAVVRNRMLAAASLGYTYDEQRCDYGLQPSRAALPWLPAGRCAVMLHATSRADKLWRDADWIALGAWLDSQGLHTVLPWGNDAEKIASERLAAAMPNAVIAPRMSLAQAAQLLADAALVVGVDTGLAHLAVAVGAPAIGIYTSTDPGLTGLYSALAARDKVVNLGGSGSIPDCSSVIAAAARMLGA
jgi:heptosyltransferase-1